jgi:hypothetical protein
MCYQPAFDDAFAPADIEPIEPRLMLNQSKVPAPMPEPSLPDLAYSLAKLPGKSRDVPRFLRRGGPRTDRVA